MDDVFHPLSILWGGHNMNDLDDASGMYKLIILKA